MNTINMNIKQGDLLKAFDNGEIDVIMHCENCEGLNYFKGIAKVIHDKYPELTKLHVEHCKNLYAFGSSLILDTDKGKVINLYGQLFRGAPSNREKVIEPINKGEIYTQTIFVDNFESRLQALESSLKSVKKEIKDRKVGIPLLLSGLASNKKLKGYMTDLEYFKKYIAPIVKETLKDYNVTVYYL